METISSRQNPIVRTFRSLAQNGSDAHVLLDGAHLVLEALDAGVRVTAAAFNARLLASPDADTVRLVGALERSGVRMVSVSPAVLAAMSPVRTPSGVVAVADYEPPSLARAFAGTPQLVIILVGLQDPGNVGAIIRAADAAEATGVVACEGTADPFGWKALRGAMGSTFRVPVVPKQPAGLAVATSRLHGLRVIAAAPRGGTPLHEIDLRGPVALLLGGEGGGLDGSLLQSADDRVSIPMRAPVESLNVAVSGALLAYEAYRQRHGH